MCGGTNMNCMERLVFTIDGIRRFHGWTHSSLNLVLDHLSTVPEVEYRKEMSSFGFSTLQKQVIHIFDCEGLWIHLLTGRRYVDCDPAECPGVSDAKLLQQKVIRWTEDYLSSLTDEQVNTETELRFPGGEYAVRTPALLLHHVFTHAFHHKGQIAAMCRALGRPIRDTDLNNFE